MIFILVRVGCSCGCRLLGDGQYYPVVVLLVRKQAASKRKAGRTLECGEQWARRGRSEVERGNRTGRVGTRRHVVFRVPYASGNLSRLFSARGWKREICADRTLLTRFWQSTPEKNGRYTAMGWGRWGWMCSYPSYSASEEGHVRSKNKWVLVQVR